MEIYGHSLFSILRHQGLPLPSSVLQVGASAGQEIDQFYSEGIRSGIFLEPLDQPFQLLTHRCRGKPNFVPVQALALAKDSSSSKFYVANNGGASSSILKPKKHLDYYPHVRFEGQVDIIGHRADTIAAFTKKNYPELPDAYDLFFLDVQGAELEVMKGAISQLQNGRYIYAEIGDGNGYEGDVRLIDLISFLRLFDYRAIALEASGKDGYGNCLWAKLGL
jgi:FkbM family methyltransferase